jgi:hypothetical protein
MSPGTVTGISGFVKVGLFANHTSAMVRVMLK